MTEEEWFAQTHPYPMLAFVLSGTSTRKLRLFACACCRRVLRLMPDPRSHRALNVAEQFADGRVDDTERMRVLESLLGVPNDHARWALMRDVGVAAERGAADAAHAVESSTKPARRTEARRGESAAQVVLVRDIVGNPFRPVTCDPAWRTSDVLALARGIYDDRAFDRMPILADALQDAGCASDEVLNHCRDTSRAHARGCWLVDLLLGKE